MTITLTLSHNDRILELKNIGTIVESSPNRRINFYPKTGDEVKSFDLLDINHIKIEVTFK